MPAFEVLEKCTIARVFERNLRRFPNKIIQVFEDGTRQSYEQLNRKANRLANALMGLGLKKGDHVAFCSRNCQEFLEFQLAVSKAGMVGVLINNLSPKERIAYTLDHSDSKAVLFEELYWDAVHLAKGQTEALEHFVMLGDGRKSGALNYEALLSKASDQEPDVEVLTTDPHTLFYTSGTTGEPKGVLKTMGAIMRHVQGTQFYYPSYDAVHKMGNLPFEHNITLCIAPQFHIGGQSLTIWPLIFPGTNVLSRPPFEPEKFMRLIYKERVTSSWILPAMLYEIKKLPEKTLKKYDVSSLISLTCGSTSLKINEMQDMLAFFENASLGSNYGSTEAGMISYVSHEVLTRTRGDNLGTPVYDSDAIIGDADGNELPVGQVGLIWSSTPSLPINCEYYKDPERSRENFKNGWVNHSDLGWQDERGYLYYFGRDDDVISSGGEKVAPDPIESALMQHSDVLGAAVIGVPDPKWGESVKACVILKEGTEVTEKALIDFCRDKLARYEVPKSVDFLEAFPLGPTGKVSRRNLREKYKEES